MKKLDIFSRRRGFNNDQGVIGIIGIIIVLIGGIVLLFVLSKIIVPLIILLVLGIVFSVVIKWVFRVKAPRYVGRMGEEAMRYGVRGARAGASWFGKLIGGS